MCVSFFNAKTFISPYGWKSLERASEGKTDEGKLTVSLWQVNGSCRDHMVMIGAKYSAVGSNKFGFGL